MPEKWPVCSPADEILNIFLKILSYLERWRQQWYAVFRACQEEVDALSIMQLIIRRRIGMLWIL